MNLTKIKTDLEEWLLGEVVSAQLFSLPETALGRNPEARRIGSFLGVYVLYHNGEVAYAGKVSGKKSKLKSRLRMHYNKIKRHGIDPAECECKMIPVREKLLILSLEDMLINHLNPPWNGMDFGSNMDLLRLNSPTRRDIPRWTDWANQYLKTKQMECVL